MIGLYASSVYIILVRPYRSPFLIRTDMKFQDFSEAFQSTRQQSAKTSFVLGRPTRPRVSGISGLGAKRVRYRARGQTL